MADNTENFNFGEDSEGKADDSLDRLLSRAEEDEASEGEGEGAAFAGALDDG